MKKIILFDLDGTLVNTKEGITKCAAYALEYFGIQVEDHSRLDFFIGPPLYLSFQDFYGFDEEKALAAAAKYRERYKDTGIFECELYEGVLEMIRTLHDKGYLLGVATSKPEVFAKRIIERFGMSSYFSYVTGSLLDNSRSAKNEVILEAFKRFGVGERYQKEEVLMVGDRKHDIIGAKETGIQSIGVLYGFARGNELEESGADYVAAVPGEVVKLIETMK